ncbi:pyridoxal phosphate-dependent aminotransferase [Desulfurococcus amylolyticus]|uniref:pyridoxal phosphate-dependent aminotransferase n=1 Tax=Desulfurococcus amylolyticus TaxID=94694 RepID=UPI000324F780|nr:pyridoxal phosphate-dependent aminotransferase [Desulfurococcus amylolyticus]
MNISRRVLSLPVNPQRVLIAKAEELSRQGVKVYNYTAGQPGLPPDREALEYFIEMVRKDPFKHFRYVSTQGLPELRAAISDDLKRYGGIDVQPKDILVTTGGADGLVLSIYTLLDERDTLLLLDPSYSVYWDLAKLAGLKVETCRQTLENGFNPDPECIKEKLGSKAKAILLASPDNPTSRILSSEVGKTIVDVAYEKKAWIIYDVAYKHLVYEEEHLWLEKLAPSMDNIVVVGSFSKDIAIPGGRLGYVYGSGNTISEMTKLKGVLGIVAPVPMQWMAYYYLSQGFKEKYLRDVIPAYKRRRDAAYEAFRRNLPHARIQKPVASMYLFPDMSYYIKKKGLSDVEFTMKLIEEKGVAMLPGSIFGEAGVNHLRITFVTMDEKNLVEGIERLAEFVGER